MARPGAAARAGSGRSDGARAESTGARSLASRALAALAHLSRPRMLIVMAGVVVLLACGFKPAVSGDGNGYFSYLHSVVIDHDLNMTDEYGAARAAGVAVSGDKSIVAKTGLPSNQYPIGPALLSLPAYLIALAVHPNGEPQFGPPFTTAYTLASLFYGALALAICYRLLRRLKYSTVAASAAVAAVALATPFFDYALYEPSYSHTYSAFMVSAFVDLWWTRREQRSVSGWLVLGLVGGLMGLVRWQDGLLMAMTIFDIRQARWRLFLMIPGALLAFSPQLVVDQVIFGQLLPSQTHATFDPLHGHYVQVLFSSWRGLFVWSPVLLAAVAGYWFVKQRTLQAAFILCFLTQLAIVGAFSIWWGGASFGMRFFINLTPFFAIGLGALATKLRPRVLWVGVGSLVAWNLLLILNQIYVIQKDEDAGYVGLVLGQIKALRYIPHWGQGYVARAFLRALFYGNADVLGALAVLMAEILIVVAAFWFAASGTLVTQRATSPTVS